MGALASYLWSPGQEETDAATGLTPREKAAIRTTWSLVKKNLADNGEDLLIMFFEMYPEHQKRFKPFADKDLSELRGNKKFRAHANSVMYAVTSVVDNLEEPETLVGMLKKLGQIHRQRHGIPKQGFVDLKNVILKLLSEKLGSKYTPLANQAWDKVLDVLNKVVFMGMDEVESESSVSS